MATIGIVFSHATQYMAGQYWWEAFSEKTSLNVIVSIIFGIWGQVSVAIFIAISAYFLCDSKKVNYSSLFKLCIQTVVLNFIVRMGGLLVNDALSPGTIVKESVKAVMSPISGEYWFVTGFIALMLVLPMLRSFIEHASRNRLRNLCLVFIITMSIADLIYYRFAGAIFDFIAVFLIVSYFKKYHSELSNKARWIAITSLICLTLSVLGINVVGTSIGIEKINRIATHIFVNWNVVIVASAVGLLWTFKNMKIKQGKVLNWVAKCSMGVYLISENSVTSSNYLWNRLLWENDIFYKNIFPVKFIVSVAAVYFICLIIESIRILLFDKVIYKQSKIKKFMGDFNNLMNG